MEEQQDDEATNGFNDWETLSSTHIHTHNRNHHNHNSHPSSASSHKLTTHFRHHLENHLSIFPPINHEGLPIPPPPPPPHASLSFSNSDSDSPSSSSPPPPPPPKPSSSQLIKWFDFALHIWNSKLHSSLSLLRSRGLYSTILPVSFLGFLWFWVRLRRCRRLRSFGVEESIEHLKLVIKEKDEKIIQLLEQIALMNKVLLAQYRVPVLRSS